MVMFGFDRYSIPMVLVTRACPKAAHAVEDKDTRNVHMLHKDWRHHSEWTEVECETTGQSIDLNAVGPTMLTNSPFVSGTNKCYIYKVASLAYGYFEITSLDKRVSVEICRQYADLWMISIEEYSLLERYKEKFSERYGTRYISTSQHHHRRFF